MHTRAVKGKLDNIHRHLWLRCVLRWHRSTGLTRRSPEDEILHDRAHAQLPENPMPTWRPEKTRWPMIGGYRCCSVSGIT